MRRDTLLFRLLVVGSYFLYYRFKDTLHYKHYVSTYQLLYGNDKSPESITRILRKYSEDDAPVKYWERVSDGYFRIIEPLDPDAVREELKRRGALMKGIDILHFKTKLFNIDLDALFVLYLVARKLILNSNNVATYNYIKSNINKLIKKGLIKEIEIDPATHKIKKVVLSKYAEEVVRIIPIIIRYFSREE